MWSWKTVLKTCSLCEIISAQWCELEVKWNEKEAEKWQINKHPTSFARKLRILCGRVVLIDGGFQWFSAKGMHLRRRTFRICAWSLVKSHRKYQVTEMYTTRARQLWNSALLYIRSLCCYCSRLCWYSNFMLLVFIIYRREEKAFLRKM